MKGENCGGEKAPPGSDNQIKPLVEEKDILGGKHCGPWGPNPTLKQGIESQKPCTGRKCPHVKGGDYQSKWWRL